MQSDSNTSNQRDVHTNPNDTSMDPSIAAFATGLDNDAKGLGENLPPNGKPSSPDVSMQSSLVEKSDLSRNQHNAEAGKQIDSSFPADYSDTNSRIKEVLKELGRYQDSRTRNPPLLLDDLKELGMVCELTEDQKFGTMSFEDLHRLSRP